MPFWKQWMKFTRNNEETTPAEGRMVYQFPKDLFAADLLRHSVAECMQGLHCWRPKFIALHQNYVLSEKIPGITVRCFCSSRLTAATLLKGDTCFARHKRWSMSVCSQRKGHLVGEVKHGGLTQGNTIGNKRVVRMPTILRDLAAEMIQLLPVLSSQNIVSKNPYPKVVT